MFEHACDHTFFLSPASSPAIVYEHHARKREDAGAGICQRPGRDSGGAARLWILLTNRNSYERIDDNSDTAYLCAYDRAVTPPYCEAARHLAKSSPRRSKPWAGRTVLATCPMAEMEAALVLFSLARVGVLVREPPSSMSHRLTPPPPIAIMKEVPRTI